MRGKYADLAGGVGIKARRQSQGETESGRDRERSQDKTNANTKRAEAGKVTEADTERQNDGDRHTKTWSRRWRDKTEGNGQKQTSR